MASVSSIAVWFSQNSGQINLVWLGWEISTSLSIFLLATFIFFFTLLILFLVYVKINIISFKIKNNIKNIILKKLKMH